MRCSVTIPLRDQRSADSVMGALLPERASGRSRRTKIGMSSEGRTIHLEVESEDTVSMRAAVNSYLRWFILAKGVTEMAGDERDGE